MKDKDLLLYGGAAIAAYFLFFKPKPVPKPATGTTYLPTNTNSAGSSPLASNNTGSLITQGTNLLSTILQSFHPGSSPSGQTIDVDSTSQNSIEDINTGQPGVLNPGLFNNGSPSLASNYPNPSDPSTQQYYANLFGFAYQPDVNFGEGVMSGLKRDAILGCG